MQKAPLSGRFRAVFRTWVLGLLVLSSTPAALSAGGQLRIVAFEVDASPPVGSPLAYDPTKEISSPLSCRCFVLTGANEPIVVCAIDWLGVANQAQTEFRQKLARAAGTTIDRVTVHSLHQHDAPRCDFSADDLLRRYAPEVRAYDSDFAREVMDRAADRLRQALPHARPVTHVGVGSADVEKVASNRRILGPDGKVAFMRWTACTDPEIRAKPVGVIDPSLKMIGFWEEEEPLVVLTYYATHPQSHYRTGGAHPDFPGMARNERERSTGTRHIHFTGAAGNIGAGKWNDGNPANRQVLADRLANAMKRAWEGAPKQRLEAGDVFWKSLGVELPVAAHLSERQLLETLADPRTEAAAKLSAAKGLAWLRRSREGELTPLSCLKLGRARILHMPGELFVEYQLAAQAMRPDLWVAMAAYGEYGSGYIGTTAAYDQGGYETSDAASLVSPGVEEVLLAAVRQLLSD
jgi:hypothetical protein